LILNPSTGNWKWVAALVALLTVQWARFLFTDNTFYFRDLYFFFAPLIAETGRQWGLGVLPAWNPLLACGTPLAADPNAGAFFPDILTVALLGSGLPAVKALLLLRLALVPLAAYAALRAIPLSPAGALVGAAFVSVSGPLATSLSSFPGPLAGAIFFLPLAVAGFRQAAGGPKEVSISALLLGLTLLAGSPELILQSVAVFVACALALPLYRSAVRVVAALMLGAFLAAPQWLPAMALFPRTSRGLGRLMSTPPGVLSFPPVRLLELLWPGLFGDPASPAEFAYWGRGLTEGTTPYLLSVAVGLLPLALVPLALRHPIGRRLAIPAAGFVLLSFGRHLPWGEAILRAPLLRGLRYPEKWWIGATLALAALGAIGWQQLREGESAPIRGAATVAGCVLCFSAFLAAAAWLTPSDSVRALRRLGLDEVSLRSQNSHVAAVLRREGLTGAVAALTILLALLACRRLSLRTRAAGFLAAAAVAERLWRVAWAVPAAPLETLRRLTPDIAAARTISEGGRFYYDQEATTLLDPLRPFTGTLFGLSYAGNTDIDQFSDVRARDFADTLQGLTFLDSRKTALLRLANVRAVDTDDPSAASSAGLFAVTTTPSGRILYRLEGARPARLFYEAVRADGLATANRFLRARGLPTETVAVVEGHDELRGKPADHRLSDVEWPRPDTFRVHVDSEKPGLLQIAVTFDRNWRVSIDGERQKIFPIDAAFLGVEVPSGRHLVAGQYRDPLFSVGALTSLVALTLCALVVRQAMQSRPAVP
jgi:hypothetical protein